MQVHAFTVKISNCIATTSSVVSANPIDAVADHLNEKIDAIAQSIYLAVKQLFIDMSHFLLVDVLGKLSILVIVIGCLLVMLGSKKQSTKLIKGGAVGALVSLIATMGWT